MWLSNYTQNEAMHNLWAHQLPWHYQPQWVHSTRQTALVIWYTHCKLAYCKILQNFWLAQILMKFKVFLNFQMNFDSKMAFRFCRISFICLLSDSVCVCGSGIYFYTHANIKIVCHIKLLIHMINMQCVLYVLTKSIIIIMGSLICIMILKSWF